MAGFRRHPSLGLIVLPVRTRPKDAWARTQDASEYLAEIGYQLICEPSVAEHLNRRTAVGATTLIPIPRGPDLASFARAVARRLPGQWTARVQPVDNEHQRRALTQLLTWSVGDHSRLQRSLDQVTTEIAVVLSGPYGQRLLVAPEPGRPHRFTLGPIAPVGLNGEDHWPSNYRAPHLSVPSNAARAAHRVATRALPGYLTAAQHSRFEILLTAAVGIGALTTSAHVYVPEPRDAVLDLLQHAPHFLDAVWAETAQGDPARTAAPQRLVAARDALDRLQAVEDQYHPQTGSLPAWQETPTSARQARDEAGWAFAVQIASEIPHLAPGGDGAGSAATPRSAAARQLLRHLTPAPGGPPATPPAVPRRAPRPR
jgi:hypothetical protein